MSLSELKAKSIMNSLKSLACFKDFKEDHSFYYLYFAPNKNDCTYGIRIHKIKIEIQAIYLAAGFWDIDCDFGEMIDSLSENDSNDILFNLDKFR